MNSQNEFYIIPESTDKTDLTVLSKDGKRFDINTTFFNKVLAKLNIPPVGDMYVFEMSNREFGYVIGDNLQNFIDHFSNANRQSNLVFLGDFKNIQLKILLQAKNMELLNMDDPEWHNY